MRSKADFRAGPAGHPSAPSQASPGFGVAKPSMRSQNEQEMTSEGIDHQPGSENPLDHDSPDGLAKLDLDAIQPRDVITMQTADGVSYRILVGTNHRAILLASDEPPPARKLIIQGGTNEDSSEFTPNRLYAGGRLAYAFSESDETLHTTPVITRLAWNRSPV